MIEFDIIDELGDSADLLTKSDTWLTATEVTLGQKLTLLLRDLDQIQKTIRIKRRLQQNNQVAIKRPVRGGRIADEVIEILPLPKAIKLASQTDRSQINIWAADGYDVQMAY